MGKDGKPKEPLHPTPFALHPTPYTPHPSPHTLHPTPFTPHPTPYTLHPTPYTIHPTLYTLNPEPSQQDAGMGKDGKPKDTFARGMELRSRPQTPDTRTPNPEP